METSTKKGLSFGITSGIITTLGLMVGLNSGTHSKLAVIGGVLTIAIADAFSDALGIHVSEEAENKHSHKEVWLATISTFLAKFGFAMTIIIPLLLFSLPVAVGVNIGWGILVLTVLNYQVTKAQKSKPWKIVFEHLAITVLVVVATNFVGKGIAAIFN
ncbi:MAG: hypothetical protein ACD_68C00033G0001 [uncultured bacterium]|nr:MAG: hypothetical protein ACD_68C00033G0001 [uncultured bacterium]